MCIRDRLQADSNLRASLLSKRQNNKCSVVTNSWLELCAFLNALLRQFSKFFSNINLRHPLVQFHLIKDVHFAEQNH